MQEKQVIISKEEYEKLKKIEEDTQISRQKAFSLYDKVKIPVGVLDCVIVGGILLIIITIVLAVACS